MYKYPSIAIALLFFLQTPAMAQTPPSGDSQQPSDAMNDLIANEKKRHEKAALARQKQLEMQKQQEEKQKEALAEQAINDERLIPALRQRIISQEAEIKALKARLHKCMHPYG